MAERIDGWHMGYKAARFDFDRGRKLGRAVGFWEGFATAIAVVAIVMTIVLL